MRDAICDTSPIQYLHQTGFLYLLPEFYAQIRIPPAVVDGLQRGKTIGVDLPDVRSLPWLKIQPPQTLNRVPATSDLGAGEREVLALGTQIPGSFTGTLGIFLRAKAENRIPQIGPVLETLAQRGLPLSAKTYAAVLRQAGK